MTRDEKDKAKNELPDSATTDRKNLGVCLREAREYIGLSQEEVARYLSIPRTALSHIETGQRRVDALELKKLAQLYKRPVGYFTGDEPMGEALPDEVAHLARAASGLSSRDREELKRFADYLRARAQTGAD